DGDVLGDALVGIGTLDELVVWGRNRECPDRVVVLDIHLVDAGRHVGEAVVAGSVRGRGPAVEGVATDLVQFDVQIRDTAAVVVVEAIAVDVIKDCAADGACIGGGLVDTGVHVIDFAIGLEIVGRSGDGAGAAVVGGHLGGVGEIA